MTDINKTRDLCESYNFTIEEQKNYINSLIEILQPDIIEITSGNKESKRFVYSDTHGDFIALVGPLVQIGVITLKTNEFIYYNFQTGQFTEELSNSVNSTPEYLVLPKATRNELFKGEVYILGDFIDRGEDSILSLLFLENLINFPENEKNIFLAIGNHEIDCCKNSQIFDKAKPIINRMINNKILKTGYLIKENDKPVALWHSAFDDELLINIIMHLFRVRYTTLKENSVFRNINTRFNFVVADIDKKLTQIFKHIQKKILTITNEPQKVLNDQTILITKSIETYMDDILKNMKLLGSNIENINLYDHKNLKNIMNYILFNFQIDDRNDLKTILNDLFELNFLLATKSKNKIIFYKQLFISNIFIQLGKTIMLDIPFKNITLKITDTIKKYFTPEDLINIKITLGDFFLELNAKNDPSELNTFCNTIGMSIVQNLIFWNRYSNKYPVNNFCIKQYVGHDSLDNYEIKGNTTFVDIKRSSNVNKIHSSKISIIDLSENIEVQKRNIIYIPYNETVINPEITQESTGEQTRTLKCKMKVENFLCLKNKYIDIVSLKKQNINNKNKPQNFYYELIDCLAPTVHSNFTSQNSIETEIIESEKQNESIKDLQSEEYIFRELKEITKHYSKTNTTSTLTGSTLTSQNSGITEQMNIRE